MEPHSLLCDLFFLLLRGFGRSTTTSSSRILLFWWNERTASPKPIANFVRVSSWDQRVPLLVVMEWIGPFIFWVDRLHSQWSTSLYLSRVGQEIIASASTSATLGNTQHGVSYHLHDWNNCNVLSFCTLPELSEKAQRELSTSTSSRLSWRWIIMYCTVLYYAVVHVREYFTANILPRENTKTSLASNVLLHVFLWL